MESEITNEQICAEFEHLFYDWICHDLSAGIENKENYLVALGLFSYIEFLGSLLTGDVGFNAPNKVNFDTAIKLFPQNYINLDSAISVTDQAGTTKSGLYSLVRCGFVHEYGIKGLGGVVSDPDGYTTNNLLAPLNSESGVNLKTIKFQKAIEIDNNRLLYDFKQVLDEVNKKLQDNESPEIDNFRTGFSKLAGYKLN